jgi:hypothetical protein
MNNEYPVRNKDDDHGTFAITYQLGKCYLRWEIYNAKAKITRVVKYI